MDREWYGRLWYIFAKRCKRKGWGVVWRRELQKRLADHWHLIVSVKEPHGMDIQIEWWGALEAMGTCDHVVGDRIYHGNRITFPGALYRACQVETKDLTGRWLRYMQDHSSKSKREQECTSGRHWGVINKGLYRVVRPESELLSRGQYAKVLRGLRRMLRPRVRCPGVPFDCRLGYESSRGRIGSSSWFLELSKRGAVRRLIEWARNSDRIGVVEFGAEELLQECAV
jgi:hypothetical protein